MRWQIAKGFADQFPGNAGHLICDVPTWPGGPGWLLYSGSFIGLAAIGARIVTITNFGGVVIPGLSVTGPSTVDHEPQMVPFSAPAGSIEFEAFYANAGDAISDLTAYIVTPDA